tara:strand:- start:134 stop:262 length:129 start_codon:yes stop_codon:yes gene_type:complete
MRSQALNKKLNSVKNQMPVTAKPEEEEAIQCIRSSSYSGARV